MVAPVISTVREAVVPSVIGSVIVRLIHVIDEIVMINQAVVGIPVHVNTVIAVRAGCVACDDGTDGIFEEYAIVNVRIKYVASDDAVIRVIDKDSPTLVQAGGVVGCGIAIGIVHHDAKLAVRISNVVEYMFLRV